MNKQFSRIKEYRVFSTLIFFCVVFCISCSSRDEREVSRVSKQYLHALFVNVDTQEARKYATAESAMFLNLLDSNFKKTDQLQEVRKNNTGVIVEITKVKVMGERALVSFQLERPHMDAVVDRDLELKKVDGKWLVHQGKDQDRNAVKSPNQVKDTVR